MKHLILAIALISASSRVGQAQSLKDTTDWLQKFVQADTLLFSVNMSRTESYRIVTNGCEILILQESQDGSCTIPGATCSAPVVKTSHYKQTFNLKDIDPGRIVDEDEPRLRHAETVLLFTTNKRRLV